MIWEAIRGRTLFSAYRNEWHSEVTEIDPNAPALVAGDVKTPSAWLPGYGKSTADCHFRITGDFFINGTGLRTGAAGILMLKSPPPNFHDRYGYDYDYEQPFLLNGEPLSCAT